MTVTDTPPNGVTVLFFQLDITGATLVSQSGTNVTLLSSARAIPVNVSQLQTEIDFLGSQNVAAGTYTSLNVTFGSAQYTIYNDSGAAIGSCANDTVCQITPTISPSPETLSFNSSPFPIALSANSPLGFKMDIHLDTVIQSDLSLNLDATNGVTISQVTPPSTGVPIPRLGRLLGTVQTLGSNQFTLQSWDGRAFTINVNSSTTYDYPSSVCSADAFSCVQPQQVVKVTVTLQSDGTLLASEVEYVQLSTQQTVEGNIIGLSTASGNTIMDLIVQQELSTSLPPNMPARGHRVRVTVPSTGVTYAIDSGTFTIPSTFTFASTSDLQVGQEVHVVVQGSVTTDSGGSGGSTPVGPGEVTFSTNSITLEPSQIIGTVAAVDDNALSFTLATLPAFFVPPSATPGGAPPWAPVVITVQTTSATTFSNFTNDTIAGVAVCDVVSAHGWVFATPSGATATTVVADQVVLQPWPIPLC
jgi:tellurite resistance-related uncharacterized protein